MGHPPMGIWMSWFNSWKCWHRRLGRRMGKFKSCRNKMKRMAEQLEETQKQLANQVEKTFYEESQRISKEKMCQLKIKVTTLENEKRETSEVIAKVKKRNLNLEVQLICDKSNHERLLKETKKKIK